MQRSHNENPRDLDPLITNDRAGVVTEMIYFFMSDIVACVDKQTLVNKIYKVEPDTCHCVCA